MHPQPASESSPLNDLYAQFEKFVGENTLDNLEDTSAAKIAKEYLLSLDKTHEGKVTFKAEKKPWGWGIWHAIQKMFKLKKSESYDFEKIVENARSEFGKTNLGDSEKEKLKLIINKTIEHLNKKQKRTEENKIPYIEFTSRTTPSSTIVTSVAKRLSVPTSLPEKGFKDYNVQAQNILKTLSDNPKVLDTFLSKLQSRNGTIGFSWQSTRAGSTNIKKAFAETFAEKVAPGIDEKIIYNKVLEICTKKELTDAEINRLENMVQALNSYYDVEILSISEGFENPAFQAICELAQKPENARSESEKILFSIPDLRNEIQNIHKNPTSAPQLLDKINSTIKAIESDAFKQIYALAKKAPEDRTDAEKFLFSSPYLRNEIQNIHKNPTSAPQLLEKINEVEVLKKEIDEAKQYIETLQKLKPSPTTLISLISFQKISGQSNDLPALNEYLANSKTKIESIKKLKTSKAETKLGELQSLYQEVKSEAKKLQKDEELSKLFPFVKDFLDDIAKEQFFVLTDLKDPNLHIEQLTNIFLKYKDAFKAIQEKITPEKRDELKQALRPKSDPALPNNIAQSTIHHVTNQNELINKLRKTSPEQFRNFITTITAFVLEQKLTDKDEGPFGRDLAENIKSFMGTEPAAHFNSFISRAQERGRAREEESRSKHPSEIDDKEWE